MSDENEWHRQQREQLLRRDLEVVKRTRDQLHARVGHQRRELGLLSRSYWKACTDLTSRGRALSLLAPLVQALSGVTREQLERQAAEQGGWIAAVAAAELYRRQHWHYVQGLGNGIAYSELPDVRDAPLLEETG